MTHKNLYRKIYQVMLSIVLRAAVGINVFGVEEDVMLKLSKRGHND